MPDSHQDQNRPPDARTTSLAAFFSAFFAWGAAIPDRIAALPRRARRVVPRAKAVVREHRAGAFPESNRPIVQFFLLFPGLLPMWKSLARERLSLRRRQGLSAARARAARPARASRRRPLAFVCAALALSAVGAFFSIYTMGTTVTYRGETLDIVGSTAAARRVAAKVEGITAETLGGSFAFPDDSLEYTVGLVLRSDVGEPDRLERNLTDEIGLVTYGYSLYVDDDLIGSTEYAGALDDLLEQIKRLYISEDTLSVGFAEDVRVSEGYVPTDSLVNLGYIAEVLNSTKSGEETYTVVKGDTWGKIAMEHDMNNADLLALNPGYNIDKINIGDELVISKEVSYLTVIVTERQNYVADIPYDTIYTEDSGMYQGDTKLIRAGEYGTADVVADVSYVNGVETERTVISSVTLTEPLAEKRLRGTKARPSWMPTGTFRWPASGRITSYFGYRNTGIRGASTNHMGIDIACAYGSPIYAADGGTVTYAGYKGAMGYTIIIEHGNGFVTYYEHCSSFTVSAGAHVYKGQQIAKVGSSGVASGAHCHFGVQKNGGYVNPLNYLP